MSESSESRKSSKRRGEQSIRKRNVKSTTTGTEELEGAQTSGVRIRPRKKNRSRPHAKSAKARKDDVPACRTVEKCSMGSRRGSETSQSEWLNDLIADDKPPSRWTAFCSFVAAYKVPIAASVVLAGALVYFTVKKTSLSAAAARCPFTGKTKA